MSRLQQDAVQAWGGARAESPAATLLVSAADWWLGHHAKDGLSGADLGTYTIAQILGSIGGALLANEMFAVPFALSTNNRSDAHPWLGETVATAGLLLLIFAFARTGRAVIAAPAVGAYIGAACWFTSSASFANPAVTIGRSVRRPDLKS